MKKSLWKNSLWIFFVIMTAILVPSTISRHAQTEDRSVVIAVGIDKLAEKNYELTAEIIVPRYETTYNQNAQVISAQGQNTSQAFANLSLQVGRIIGLSHCSTVVIGESMKDENIIPLIDELVRSKRANFNAQLIYTTSKARDVLQKAIEIDTGFNQNLNELVQFNDKFINAKSILLSDFYKTYYQGYGANFVSIINLTDSEYDGIADSSQSGGDEESGGGEQGETQSQQDTNQSTTGGEQSGSQSSLQSTSDKQSPMQSSSGESGTQAQSQQGGTTGKYLSNNGDTAVYYKGKLVRTLSGDEIMGFGLMTNESTRGVLIVEDITDKYLHDADLTFSIRSRTATKVVDFSKTGKPRLHYSLVLACRLEQISNNELVTREVTNDTHEFLTPTVKYKLEDTLKLKCADAVNLCKEMKLDLLDVYKEFDRFQHGKWQEYLKSLDEPANYMQDVEFFVDIVINDVD